MNLEFQTVLVENESEIRRKSQEKSKSNLRGSYLFDVKKCVKPHWDISGSLTIIEGRFKNSSVPKVMFNYPLRSPTID